MTLAQLIVVASQLSGYPTPPPEATPPVVQRISSGAMRSIGCPGLAPARSCPIAALYRHGIIFVDAEWLASPLNVMHYTESSYVVHELVHWLQDRSGRMRGYTCPESLVLEQQAYDAQNIYERRYEHRRTAQHQPPPMCGDSVVIVYGTQLDR